MLSGKLISNRKERSYTYQLFTQESLGLLFRICFCKHFLNVCPFSTHTHSNRDPCQMLTLGAWESKTLASSGPHRTRYSRKDTLHFQGCQFGAFPSAGLALSGITRREPGALDISLGCPASLNLSYSRQFHLTSDNWPANGARLLEIESYL